MILAIFKKLPYNFFIPGLCTLYGTKCYGLCDEKKLLVRLTQTIATSLLVIDSRKQLGNTTYSACIGYEAPPV